LFTAGHDKIEDKEKVRYIIYFTMLDGKNKFTKIQKIRTTHIKRFAMMLFLISLNFIYFATMEMV